MITNSDVVIIENLFLSEYELDICKKISSNTINTWQKNKSESAIYLAVPFNQGVCNK